MRVIDEKRVPQIGEVCALKIKDIRMLDIRLAVDVADPIYSSISEENLEKNAEIYEKAYKTTIEQDLDGEKIDKSDYGMTYEVWTKNIDKNETEAITFVKYLGSGMFLDLIGENLLMADITEYSTRDYKEGDIYSKKEARKAEEAYVDFIMKDNTSRGFLKNRTLYTRVCLVFEYETAELCTIDASIVRKFMSQDMRALRECMDLLHKQASYYINKQIDLLPKQDQYFLNKENN